MLLCAAERVELSFVVDSQLKSESWTRGDKDVVLYVKLQQIIETQLTMAIENTVRLGFLCAILIVAFVLQEGYALDTVN